MDWSGCVLDWPEWETSVVHLVSGCFLYLDCAEAILDQGVYRSGLLIEDPRHVLLALIFSSIKVRQGFIWPGRHLKISAINKSCQRQIKALHQNVSILLTVQADYKFALCGYFQSAFTLKICLVEADAFLKL